MSEPPVKRELKEIVETLERLVKMEKMQTMSMSVWMVITADVKMCVSIPWVATTVPVARADN